MCTAVLISWDPRMWDGIQWFLWFLEGQAFLRSTPNPFHFPVSKLPLFKKDTLLISSNKSGPMSDYRPYVICTLFPATSNDNIVRFVSKNYKGARPMSSAGHMVSSSPCCRSRHDLSAVWPCGSWISHRRHNDRCKWQLEIYYVWYYGTTRWLFCLAVRSTWIHMPANPEAAFKEKTKGMGPLC